MLSIDTPKSPPPPPSTPISNKTSLPFPHTQQVQYLVESGDVDINRADNDRWTPLHLAAYDGHLSVVRYNPHPHIGQQRLYIY